MRTAFDLSPFRRSTVGFDRLFDLLERGGGQPLNALSSDEGVEIRGDIARFLF